MAGHLAVYLRVRVKNEEIAGPLWADLNYEIAQFIERVAGKAD